MKKTLTTLLLLACSCAATLPATAQKLDMKPGLWELDSRMSSSDPQMQAAMGQMQQQLANMSPEQRQSIQQMLERNGLQVNIGSGGAIQTRMCVTREMIERKEFPVQQGECKQNVTPLSAGRMKVAFTCTKPRVSGEGEMTMQGDSNYRARMRVRSEGRPGTVDTDVNAKWLGAECGSAGGVKK